jgi:hypothetical protein
MLMRNPVPMPALLLGLGLMLNPLAASAAFDGKTNLVCASMDVAACVAGPTCLQGSAKSFDLPVFMFFDYKGKVVRTVDSAGDKAVSPIQNRETTKSQIILQGVENHRGWTAAIDRQSGDMAISVTGGDGSFTIFGACTTP